MGVSLADVLDANVGRSPPTKADNVSPCCSSKHIRSGCYDHYQRAWDHTPKMLADAVN
jgi:hypothetical protein